MRRLTKCLMLTGLLAGCDTAANSLEPGSPAIPGPSLAALVSRYTVTEPFSMVFDNPCNGTTVQVIGQIVHTFQAVTDSPESGLLSMHWKDNSRVSGTGLGSDGTTYVFNDTDMEIFQSPTPTAPQITFTSYDAPRLVSTGSSPNFMMHLQYHITITPDGTFKTLAELDHTECRG